MPASPSCLTGLVGLSRAASPCFPLPVGTTEAPVDTAFITESSTGRYVDEVEGLHLRPAPNITAATDAWARFDKARSQAIGFVENELSRMLSGKTGPLLPVQGGKFGSLGDGSYMGVGVQPLLRFPTRLLPGRGYRLVSLSLYASEAVADVPVLLNGVELLTITTSTTSTTSVELPADTIIPFDGKVHELTAVLPEGVRARVGKLTCGCSLTHPDVALATLGLRGETLTSAYNRNATTGGFVLHLETVCLTPNRLCYALEVDEELRNSVAFAIQYKTAEYIAVSLLADAKYSAYTSLDAKALEYLAEHYHTLNHSTDTASPGHLSWLAGATGLPRVQHPCYACAPSVGPRLVR